MIKNGSLFFWKWWTLHRLKNSWFKIRFVKMIITLSVSVDLPYLHILVVGNVYNTQQICITSGVWTHNRVCSIKKHNFLQKTCHELASKLSCILDSWVAYGLVILFHSFLRILLFSFWSPKVIIYEFEKQKSQSLKIVHV